MKRKATGSLLTITLIVTLTACAMPNILPKSSTSTPVPSATPEASPTATAIVLRPTATPQPTATAIPRLAPVVSAASASFAQGHCPFETDSDNVRCGYMMVPEDHYDPTGPTIRLAVAVYESESKGRRPDPVILLGSGLGTKVMEDAPAVAKAILPMIGDRDLILFDQRGAGLSEPALDCPEIVDALFETLNAADVEEAGSGLFAGIEACRKRLVASNIHLELYNTMQSAADVEAIRLALGYDKVNLMGAWYGSQVAQAVMRDHEQGIRSAVLASAVPLDASLRIDRPLASQQAIAQLLDACADDGACSAAYPDLEDVLLTSIERLNEAPEPITLTNTVDGKQYPALLSGDDLYSQLGSLLYRTDQILLLPRAISQVGKEDYSLMTRLLGATLASYDATSAGVELSVICTQDLVGQTEQEYLDNLASLPKELEEATPEIATRYGPFAMCKVWDLPETPVEAKKPLISRIPSLVLAGEFDPSVPFEYAERVRAGLKNSYFYSFPSAGHNAMLTASCAAYLVRAFLDAPLLEPDMDCIDDPKEIEFSIVSSTTELTWKPYVSKEQGFQTKVPEDWEASTPGIFVPKDEGDTIDAGILFVFRETGEPEEVLESMAEDYKLEAPPRSEGSRQIGRLTWDIYHVSQNGLDTYLALAPDGEKIYFVMLMCRQESSDKLYEEVFLPVLEATEPLAQ